MPYCTFVISLRDITVSLWIITGCISQCSVEGQMDIGMDLTHILTHMSVIETHHQCTNVHTYSVVRI
jgi:hypothetical protein